MNKISQAKHELLRLIQNYQEMSENSPHFSSLTKIYAYFFSSIAKFLSYVLDFVKCQDEACLIKLYQVSIEWVGFAI